MRTARARTLVAGLLVAALLTVMLAGCGARESAEESVAGDVATEQSAAPRTDGAEPYAGQNEQSAPAADTAALPEADRMIIRSQTIRLEVESTPETVEDIRGLAKTHSGVITDLQVATDTGDWLYRYDEYGYSTGDGSALRGWVTLRVPAESLDAFVAAAMELGDVKYQSEDTQDVTQQHVDLSARLENLRAEEARLRSFFDAAKNVQEMLAVEVELNRVRQEIESLDAQVKYLERQAAMATVTIELTEERDVVSPDGDDWGFKDAITNGIRGAMKVITFGLAFVITTFPLWGIALVAFFVVRAVIKRRRAKAPSAAMDDDSPAGGTV